jgi:hypothetical protein
MPVYIGSGVAKDVELVSLIFFWYTVVASYFHLFIKFWLLAGRVGRYFDILIYRDIFNRDYRIEGRNLSNDISKLSSCLMTIVILLRMCHIDFIKS